VTQPTPDSGIPGSNPGRTMGDLVPRPDPTVLTTQLVDRALGAYREVVETRLEAMDQATKLLATELLKIEKMSADMHVHMKDDCTDALASAREYILSQLKIVESVSLEKFAAITTQFAERDTRTEQAAQESRISLGAALAAAKEAVGEQNTSNTRAIEVAGVATQKQIDSLAALMTTSIGSLEDKIADVKSRLDRGEGQGTGEEKTRTNIGQSSLLLVAALGALVSIASVVVAIIAIQGGP